MLTLVLIGMIGAPRLTMPCCAESIVASDASATESASGRIGCCGSCGDANRDMSSTPDAADAVRRTGDPDHRSQQEDPIRTCLGCNAACCLKAAPHTPGRVLEFSDFGDSRVFNPLRPADRSPAGVFHPPRS